MRKGLWAAGILVPVLAAGCGGEVVHDPDGTMGQPVMGLVRVTEATPKSSAETREVSARCPDDKKVISGGARIVGGGRKVRLTALAPVEGDNAYRARAAEYDGGHRGRWSLEAYALCAIPLIGLKYARYSDEEAVENEGASTARCRTGQTVLGGGVEAMKNPYGSSERPDYAVAAHFDTFTHPDNPEVRASVVSAPDEPASFEQTVAHAVCADPVGRLTVAGDSFWSEDGAARTATLKAECPSDLSLLSAYGQAGPQELGAFFPFLHPGYGLTSAWADSSLKSASFSAHRVEGSTGPWGLKGTVVCGTAFG